MPAAPKPAAPKPWFRAQMYRHHFGRKYKDHSSFIDATPTILLFLKGYAGTLKRSLAGTSFLFLLSFLTVVYAPSPWQDGQDANRLQACHLIRWNMFLPNDTLCGMCNARQTLRVSFSPAGEGTVRTRRASETSLVNICFCRTIYLMKPQDGEMTACLGATLTGVYRTNARLTRGLFSFTAWTIEVYHFLSKMLFLNDGTP